MAQLAAVTGMPRLRRNQTAELNARLPFLSQILAQKSQGEYQKATLADLAAQRKLEEQRYGIEQGKFGLAQQEYGLKEQGLELEKRKLSQGETEFGWQKTQAEKAREVQEATEQK